MAWPCACGPGIACACEYAFEYACVHAFVNGVCSSRWSGEGFRWASHRAWPRAWHGTLSGEPRADRVNGPQTIPPSGYSCVGLCRWKLYPRLWLCMCSVLVVLIDVAQLVSNRSGDFESDSEEVSGWTLGLGYVFIICCILSIGILLLSFFRIKHLDLTSEALMPGEVELKEANEHQRSGTAYLTTDGRQLSHRSNERVC